jgi:hypothetical protein
MIFGVPVIDCAFIFDWFLVKKKALRVSEGFSISLNFI